MLTSGKLKFYLVLVAAAVFGFVWGNLANFSLLRALHWFQVPTSSATRDSFADVAERVNPSVVSVVSSKIVDLNQIHEGFEWAPLKPDEDGRRKSLGFGSGFVINSRGLIVTNEHVIDDARRITVRLYDGSEFPGELVGTDKETDLALVKVVPKKRLRSVRLGDSDRLRVGDWVMAIGNPYNYDHTVTVGVVSAKDRKIDDNPFESYIQTDASINVGSSGGPLFDADGDVVAINAAISTKGRGIGFAIPINLAKNVIRQLEERGRVVRGFLGLRPEAVTEAHAKILGLASPQGVLVSEVSPDMAAEKAGVRRYDVITQVDGKPIRDKEEFFARVAQAVPGTMIKLSGIRDRKPMNFDVVVGERLASNQAPLPAMSPESQTVTEAATGDLGITVQELTDQQRQLYRLERRVAGVVVVNVSSISPAADAGLSVGEIILEVNKLPVRSLADYQRLIAHFRPAGAIMLLVSRPKHQDTRIVTLKLDE